MTASPLPAIILPDTHLPALVAAAGEPATRRFLEFFAASIRNPHTRRAYDRACGAFLAWCAEVGVPSISVVQPLHVASWIELQTRRHAAPTAKLRLAAVRQLFDWLVLGQVVPVNPAASVRGPAQVVLLVMLRRACPLQPGLVAGLVAGLGGLAAAAAASLLWFVHPLDASATDLVVHGGAVMLVIMLNRLLGRRALRLPG